MNNTILIENIIPPADITKCAVRLGAEIRNVRLSSELSDEVIRAVKQLLLKHKVLFFRGQRHLDQVEQERFAVRLGNLVTEVDATDGTSSILKEESGGGGLASEWHTEVMLYVYPKIAVLRSSVIPSCGGDTIWSNMAAAYRDLPLSLRMLADQLWAVHNNAHGYSVKARAAGAGKTELAEVFTGTISESDHPVVRVHPETGERMLVIGDFVKHFVGLQKYTGQKLFELLQLYITAPKNTVRWSWMPGDVAIWDGRAAQYYAANDYGDHHYEQGSGTSGDLPLKIGAHRRAERVNTSKPRGARARRAKVRLPSRSSP